MDQKSNNRFLAPLEGQSRLLPVVSTAKPLQLSPKRSGLVKWAAWLVNHPLARLGVATVAIAAGALLSRRMPGRYQFIPSPGRRREDTSGELFVTSVGLSIQNDCQQVSVWSITRLYPRR